MAHFLFSLSLWRSFIRELLVVGLLVGATGCRSTRNETWHCYDGEGQPVQDVLIICRYGLANYSEGTINHRFTDAKGKAILDLDDDTPKGLIRGIECIYSAKLHSGTIGSGKRWHEEQPIPDDAVYFNEWENKIYIKSGVDDPVIWHAALNDLLGTYGSYSKGGYGAAKLDATLSVLVPQERALFLAQYGEHLVPADYIKSNRLSTAYQDIRNKDYSRVKFKDITLPLPRK